MSTPYTIYLVNNSSTTKQFWCFLARPQEVASDAGVFANSSTTLAVSPRADSYNTFTIPVQYVVGAGASNNAVGLNIRIDSSVTKQTDLKQTWEADYVTVPPPQGPSMKLGSAVPPDNAIAIKSNAFNQAENEAAGWFSNMSYGIKTGQGFIGMTWSPSPQETRTLTPKLEFYVATGSFGSNELASWTEVSNSSATITVPGDFQYNNCTVTLTAVGGWQVAPGKPILPSKRKGYISMAGLDDLVQSHRILTESHAGLVAMARPSASAEAGGGPDDQQDDIVSVRWSPSSELGVDDTEIVLAGTLTVGTALLAAFGAFVLSGIRFSITSAPVGGRTINFSYSGTRSAQSIKDLFVAGATIYLSKSTS